jgi:hypothetical protein
MPLVREQYSKIGDCRCFTDYIRPDLFNLNIKRGLITTIENNCMKKTKAS